MFTEASREDDCNVARLRLLMRLLRLSQSDVCRATGFSRGFVSRLLKGDLGGSARFWMKLNSGMLDLIASTGGWSSVFRVES